MPTILSKYSPGGGFTPPRPQTHGALHKAIFEYKPTGGVFTAANPLEIGRLVSFARITDAYLFASGAYQTSAPAAVTCQIGFMTGIVGRTFMPDGTTERTVGNEIFAAGTALTGGTIVRMTKGAVLDRLPTEAEVGIGVLFSANVATSDTLRLVVEYMQYTP